MKKFPKPYFFLLGLFTFLCGLHYFSMRPLWLDEGFVLKNLEQLTIGQSFGVLSDSQAFPRVYFVLIKVLGEIFNNHLLILRFFPFIFMLGAFVVWSRIFNRSFEHSKFVLLAVFSFVCSYLFIYYSAELKPYSMDVLVVGLFCLYLFYQSKFQLGSPSVKLYLGAVLLPFLIFFSYAGLFVVWIISYNFIWLLFENKSLWRILILNVGITCFCLIIYYFVDLRYSVRHPGLHDYWDSYFICIDSVGCFFSTFGEGINRIVTYWFGTEKIHYKALIPFIPVAMFSVFNNGIRTLFKDHFKIISLGSFGFVLIAELFIFGILRFYPFTGARITLFLAPSIIYFIVKGIEDSRKIKVLYLGLFSYFLLYCIFCLGNSFFAILKFYR